MNRIVSFKLFSLGTILFFALASQTVSAKNVQCVWTKAANVRTGAGTGNKILFRVWHYEPLTVIGGSGDWVKVAEHYRGTNKKRILSGDHPRGLTGWIHKSLIKKARCLSVRSEFLNIRSGPGGKYKAKWKVQWGYPFKYLTEKGGWYKVTDGVSTGWISSNFVWSPWL